MKLMISMSKTVIVFVYATLSQLKLLNNYNNQRDSLLGLVNYPVALSGAGQYVCQNRNRTEKCPMSGQPKL